MRIWDLLISSVGLFQRVLGSCRVRYRDTEENQRRDDQYSGLDGYGGTSKRQWMIASRPRGLRDRSRRRGRASRHRPVAAVPAGTTTRVKPPEVRDGGGATRIRNGSGLHQSWLTRQ